MRTGLLAGAIAAAVAALVSLPLRSSLDSFFNSRNGGPGSPRRRLDRRPCVERAFADGPKGRLHDLIAYLAGNRRPRDVVTLEVLTDNG